MVLRNGKDCDVILKKFEKKFPQMSQSFVQMLCRIADAVIQILIKTRRHPNWFLRSRSKLTQR